MGVELAVSSVEKIILNFKEPYLPEFDARLVYVLSFSVVVKVVMFFVYRTNGKKSAVSRAQSNGRWTALWTLPPPPPCLRRFLSADWRASILRYMGLAVSVLIFVGGIKIAKDTVSG